jgi:hypothetical protein
MARPITRYESLDPQHQVVADQLREFNITWHSGFYVGPIPDPANRIQVRTKTPAASKIQAYRLGWERDDPFPGIVRTVDGVLVDGWARTEGALLARDVNSIPQFVIDVNYGEAEPAIIANLKMFAVSINQTNGETMPLANVAEVLYEAVPDRTIKAIAAAVHCSESTVQRAIAVRKAMNRVEELGIDLGDEDKITISHLVLLGGWDAVLENEVYTRFVNLTRDAGLSTNEIKAVYKMLRAVHTDEEKLAILAQEEAGARDRIAGHGTRPTGAGVVRRVAAQLRRFADTPDLALDLNPETNVEYYKDLTGYATFFADLSAKQAAIIQNRTVAIQQEPPATVRQPFRAKR